MRRPALNILSFVGFVALAAPVAAMSLQAAPRNADGSSQLADPDAQGDRVTDQMHRSDQRSARGALSAGSMVDTPSSRFDGRPLASPSPFGTPR